MEIIPAIDIKDGKCVRLLQGREDSGTVYAADPVEVAGRWSSEGAKRLHIVNLDGAFGHKSRATEILRGIASIGGVKVQFGGGLRSRQAIREAFDAGASSVVLGTVAFEDRSLLRGTVMEYGPRSVIVAVDALNGNVATRGWTQLTGTDVLSAARDLQVAGVREILFTDISRDGMMGGPDTATLKSLGTTGLSVIASGGIASLEDVKLLLTGGFEHLTGAIIGKALYEGTVSLGAAIALTAAPHQGDL